MSIGSAIQSVKALFTDLSKPQLLLDLKDRIVSFERVLWTWYTSYNFNHIVSVVVIYQIIHKKAALHLSSGW